jgi:thiosulfate/3-mercaptopyruvate sulfurtransferase
VPYTTLISTAALAEHLDSGSAPRKEWVIVDCRYDLAKEDWGREQYRAGHIPGAVYASLSHDLSAASDGSNGRHPMPTVEAMAATFSRLGVGPDMQVVAYDQDSGMFASRLWWMLRYLGHDNVAVLDGGWAKWRHERRPARSGDEQNVATPFRARPRTELRVDVTEVERLVGDPSVLLVDARASERFEGRSEPLDRIAGHIPGARNRPYRENLEAERTMRQADALKRDFDALLQGHSPSEVVMYCGSGVSACHNVLAMEHVGITGVRLYPGSWSEWSADPTRAVETGPDKGT